MQFQPNEPFCCFICDCSSLEDVVEVVDLADLGDVAAVGIRPLLAHVQMEPFQRCDISHLIDHVDPYW